MDDEPLFQNGRANQNKFGIPLRTSAGDSPEPESLEAAAQLLGRPVYFVDADGYECELIGAAINEAGDIAYVESRAKDVGENPYGAYGRNIDISIRVHLHDKTGELASADIESYNPFFGCEVRFFQWVGRSVVLIYREKHDTYACRYGNIWPPKFVEIEDAWLIHDNYLAYIGYKQEKVRRLSFPELDVLEPISKDAAAQQGLLPEDPWS